MNIHTGKHSCVDLKQDERKGRVSGEEKRLLTVEGAFMQFPKYMKVRYEVRKTSLGRGVFVLEPVKQGSLIWRCKDTIGQLKYT